MSTSISEPMRIALDALYEGRTAPAEILAALTPEEKAEVASLARTARIVGASLNQPIPTAEVEAAALARAHEAMAKKPVTTTPEKTPEPAPDNWFRRIFKKPGG